MPWINELRIWTQDLYMGCLALNNLPHHSQGVPVIRQTIGGHSKQTMNSLAPPSLRAHPNRTAARASLGQPDYKRTRQRFDSRLSRVLLVDLYTLLDKEVLLRAMAGNPNYVESGLEGNIEKAGLKWGPYPWAYARAVELAAVRNCIIHNDQKWQQGQINRLTALNIHYPYPIPILGAAIEIEMGHLFVYKSAVRQLLNT